MVQVYLPETFVNNFYTEEYENGKVVKTPKSITSATGPISVPYSGLLGASYTAEALKDKTVLEIRPGETKEFTEEQAKFLLERYGFLQKVDKAPEKAPEKALGEPSTNPELPPAAVPGTLPDTIPTNYMQLKSYAKNKGVNVEKNDTKETILKKLSGFTS